MLETLCDYIFAAVAIIFSGIFIIIAIVVASDLATTTGYSYIDMSGKSGKADHCLIHNGVLNCASGDKTFTVRESTKLKEEK